MIFVPREPHYIAGPLLGITAAIPAFILLSRWISQKIQPFFVGPRANRYPYRGAVRGSQAPPKC